MTSEARGILLLEVMCERNYKLTLILSSLPDDAVLEVDFSSNDLRLSFRAWLDTVFPVEDEVCSVFESFDLQENPDLPEIYEEFQRVVEQFRAGLCDLRVADAFGNEIDSTLAMGFNFPMQEEPAQTGFAVRELLLTPKYDALAYAAKQGYTGGEPDSLSWMQVCLAMYFLDKHETPLPVPGVSAPDNPLAPVMEEISGLGLVQWPEKSGPTEITSLGRRFIGRLLAETEEIIDRYDMLQDTVWDEETQTVFFGTGHGEDSRVEAYIAEGLDPVRAVFLLRLYDGTLDGYAGDGLTLIDDEEFLNFVLEPVVNRAVVPAEMLEEALDESMALLEATEEQARVHRLRQRVARQVTPDQA